MPQKRDLYLNGLEFHQIDKKYCLKKKICRFFFGKMIFYQHFLQHPYDSMGADYKSKVLFMYLLVYLPVLDFLKACDWSRRR